MSVMELAVVEDQLSSESQEAVPERIGVKEAVRLARSYLVDLFEDETLLNLRLEEVELNSRGDEWLITYGFTAPEPARHPLSVMAPAGPREYKIVSVDAYDGSLRSVKIRSLERIS
jgi:hypothetical protein